MKDFNPFEVIRMAEPLRYQNLKLIARWNGGLCLLACAFSVLAAFVGLLEGSVAIWEFLVSGIFIGVMLFYILRRWRWGWRKE
jgi:hypothetical protein